MAKSLELKTNVNAESLSAEQLITDRIDIWTSAIEQKSSAGRGTSNKFSLYGIKKLRELILELAVRGKLVPQDPNDEPASVLLERIAAKKAQLVKEGTLKKQKPLPEIAEEEKPFELPYGWAWGRVNELSKQVTDGVHHTPKYIESGVPFISVKDIDGKTVSFADCKYISQEQHESINQRCNPEFGDILLCRIGTLGRATVVNTFKPFSLFVSVGLIKFFNESLLPAFLHKVFHSPLLLRQYDEIKAGGSHTNKLNLGDIPKLWIPVAPLEEQHRIVAKVDELMSLCDALEAQTEASISAHQTLVETLLNALLLPNTTQQATTNTSNTLADSLEPAFDNSDANSPEHSLADSPVPSLVKSFDKAWLRIAEHFDTLFTTAASIDTLKQTILQLAVMGKLVEQDPNDEPAAKLLERITKEKAQLIKDGKIKKQSAVEPMGELVVLPDTWQQIVVQDFADIRLSSTPSRAESSFWNGEIPWVSSGEVAGNIIKDTSEKITQLGLNNSSTSIIPKRSLLMAIIGQGKTRGQTALLGIDACTNQNVAAFVFNELLVVPEFVWIWAQSKYEAHRGDGRGGAQPALNGKIVRSFSFPLPPHEEQHRIVAKVDELMALCDQLKARLSDAQTTQLHLTDAFVEQAM